MGSLKNSGGQSIGEAPLQHVHAGLVLGSAFVALSQDTTTNSQAWVTLLSTVYTKLSDDSELRINFTASANNSNQNTQVRFGLFVDGVLHRGCGCRGQGSFAQSVAMMDVITPEEAGVGPHTVEIKWEVTAGQGQIRPVTHPDDESATFLVEEVLLP